MFPVVKYWKNLPWQLWLPCHITYIFAVLIYLFKARITTKEKLLSVKVLKLRRRHFREKNPIWLPVASVCLGWHLKGWISYHKSTSTPPFKNNQGGGEGRANWRKWKLPYSPLKIDLNEKVYQTYKDADQSATSAIYKTGVFIFIKGHFYIREIKFRITFSLTFAKTQRFPFTFRLLFVINKWFQARLTVLSAYFLMREITELKQLQRRQLFALTFIGA